MATHSTVLAWRIPWTEESGVRGSTVHGVRESDTNERLNTQAHTYLYRDVGSIQTLADVSLYLFPPKCIF